MAYHHLQCLIWTTMPYLRPCNLSYTPAAFWRFTGVLIGVRSQNCCPLCHNVGWSVGHVPLTANPLFLPLISWLVDGFNPSDKYESQLGMMTFPTEWKVIIQSVPNHQPVGMVQKLRPGTPEIFLNHVTMSGGYSSSKVSHQ